jgi:hypothetical protein
MKTADFEMAPPYTANVTRFLEEKFLDRIRMVQFGLQAESLHQYIDGAKDYRYVSVVGDTVKDVLDDLPVPRTCYYNTTIITICVNNPNCLSERDIYSLMEYAENAIDKHHIEWNMSLREDQEENININVLFIKK